MREVIETQMEAWVAVTTGEKEAEKPEQRSHDDDRLRDRGSRDRSHDRRDRSQSSHDRSR